MNAVTAPKAAAKPNVKGKAPNRKTFFCTHHGADKGHNTADCFTLKNRDKQKAKPGPKKSQFSDKKFRKEINVMSKGKNRIKVLDQYAAVLNRERKKAKRMASKKKVLQSKEKAPATSSSESDSDSVVSIRVIERVEKEKVNIVERQSKNILRNVDSHNKCIRRHRLTSTILESDDEMEEEIAYHEQSQQAEEPIEEVLEH